MSFGDPQIPRPTQRTIRDLRSAGISADVICCRSKEKMDPGTIKKVSQFCDVPTSRVHSVFDVASMYHVPQLLAEQGFLRTVVEKLKLELVGLDQMDEHGARLAMEQWDHMANRFLALGTAPPVKIALVGKYVGTLLLRFLLDFYPAFFSLVNK